MIRTLHHTCQCGNGERTAPETSSPIDADLGSEAELGPCLRHDHQMFEAEILLEFLVLGGRDFLFSSALDQPSYARPRLLPGAENCDNLSAQHRRPQNPELRRR